MFHFGLLILAKDLQVTKTAPVDKTKRLHRHRTKAPDGSKNATAIGGKAGTVHPIQPDLVPLKCSGRKYRQVQQGCCKLGLDHPLDVRGAPLHMIQY
jgi:hypothetical protein